MSFCQNLPILEVEVRKVQTNHQKCYHYFWDKATLSKHINVKKSQTDTKPSVNVNYSKMMFLVLDRVYYRGFKCDTHNN
jgi:hypothetical protein